MVKREMRRSTDCKDICIISMYYIGYNGYMVLYSIYIYLKYLFELDELQYVVTSPRVMVSNGNHPQMAELFCCFQVSELLQFSQMDILCIQCYYH